jgi:hypothetical protein
LKVSSGLHDGMACVVIRIVFVVRIHGAYDGYTCKESALREDQPVGCFRGRLPVRMVHFANIQRKFGSFRGVRVQGQFASPNLAGSFESENVPSGKQDGRNDGRCRVEEEGVRVLEKEKGGRRSKSYYVEEEIGVREWRAKIEPHSRDRRKDAGEEVPRMEDSLDHARAAFTAPWPSF